MKDIKDFVPITRAKNELLELIRRVETEDDTVAITKKGVPAVVMMSMDKFEGLLETVDILSDDKTMRSLKKAIQEAKEGEWVTFDEVFKG